jgi:hypothetical protein
VDTRDRVFSQAFNVRKVESGIRAHKIKCGWLNFWNAVQVDSMDPAGSMQFSRLSYFWKHNAFSKEFLRPEQDTQWNGF